MSDIHTVGMLFTQSESRSQITQFIIVIWTQMSLFEFHQRRDFLKRLQKALNFEDVVIWKQQKNTAVC